MTFRAILKNGTISFKTAVDSFWPIIESTARDEMMGIWPRSKMVIFCFD